MAKIALLPLLILISYAKGANVTISENPLSKHVRPGELVNFTCAIQAQSGSKADIRWHLRVPDFGEEKDTFLKCPKLQGKLSKHGIIINCTQEEFAESLMDLQRETIVFVATRQMNGASIECAATDHDKGDINAFKYSNSNFDMLTVESEGALTVESEEGASGTENSSFTRPESSTSASETEESEGASGTEDSSFTRPESTTSCSASETDSSHSNSSPGTLLSRIMLSLTLIFSLCNIHS